MTKLTVTRGADFSAEIAFDDGETSPAPINLTGGAVSAVFTWYGGEQAATVTIDDAAQGLASMSLNEAETARLPEGLFSTLTITQVSAGGKTEIQRVAVEVI
jgi:hypothetical protein